MTAIPQVTPLPAPPQRGQDASTFVENADNLMDALPGFVEELNDFAPAVIAATSERVVNEAAASFAGALTARDAAIAARDQAAASAASIDPAQFVNRTAAQNIGGAKTFTAKTNFSAGIQIGGQTLAAPSAVGIALFEAADAAAQRAALGTAPVIDDFDTSGTWTKRAGAKLVQVILWGGGGGGGGAVPQSAIAGTGGTGGGYTTAVLAATDCPATVAVTIGAGGSPGSGGPGGSGGTTSFGSLIGAKGGVGGAASEQPSIYGSGALFGGGYGGAGGISSDPGGNTQSRNYEGAPAPCPGGGGGGRNNTTGWAGGVGALRFPTASSGGGGAGGAGAPGTAGVGRNGIIPGTAGGGGGAINAGGGNGGAGGSGAGGGGAGCGPNNGQTASIGGAGGGGFCRVITFF